MAYTDEERSLIARTILDQLTAAEGRGIGWARMMLGARNIVALDAGVKFEFMGNASGLNLVQVVLTADDTYTLELGTLREFKYTQRVLIESLYADQLKPLFEEHTGLYTNFGSMRG